MTKLPRAIVALVPALLTVAPPNETRLEDSRRPSEGMIGAPYEDVDTSIICGNRDPFAVDPSVAERGLRGHAATQNALAQHLRNSGREPRRPRPEEPQFDLAWEDGSRVYVAEVKSLTSRNEEQQMRLGLGQVLRYRQTLGRSGRAIRAVMAVERAPTDSSWVELCRKLDVILVWPETLNDL